MLTARMLVILYGEADEDAAARCVLSAVASAASPYGLHFAVPERMRAVFDDMAAAGEALGGGDIKHYDERLALEAIPPLITDETHFLFLWGAHDFAEKWDATLYERMKKAPDRPALLTGTLSAASEGLPSQAHLPGFGDGFDADGARIARGLPLVLSAAPVRTLCVDPALLFGTVDFLRRASLRLDALSISAYMAGYPAYALDRAPLWPLRPAPERVLRRPQRDATPGTTLARFEQQAGFRFDQGRAGVKTTWGLFFAEDSYPQTLPVSARLRSRLRDLRPGSRANAMPLVVTAFKELGERRKPIPAYMLRFGFFKDIRCLPLILYTGGSQERYLRSVFPNAWSYPDQGVLPPKYLFAGMTAEQHFKRSKLLLLLRALERLPEHTHVAWANADLIRHPICPEATPDFSALMDDRVHLATVNAIPDASFFVIPTRHAALLAREALTITQLDMELKRSLTEEALWQRLASRFPELFTLHPMPRKHLLIYTAFDPRLLSEAILERLRGLAPPRPAESKGSDTHGDKTHKAGGVEPGRAGAHHHAGGRKFEL